MERISLASMLLLVFITTQGQNLVVNGSFEEYIDCPASFGYWSEVVGWTSPFTESADYYNACADGVICSVPLNTAGYQYPADGRAYMGIITYATLMGGHYREVLATQLSEPLQPGVPVYVSFKTSPGGFGSNVNNSATWAAKGPGMNFFTELPNDWSSYLFPNASALDMPSVLSDTSAWVTVSGMYLPDSAYTWLAIANYFDNASSQPELLDETAQSNWAYAFIDDVCVSPDPSYCFSSTGIAHDHNDEPFWGVLVDGRIILHSTPRTNSAELNLFDIQGRVIWNGEWPIGQEVLYIQLPQLSVGSYFLSIHVSESSPKVLRLTSSISP